MPELSQKWGSMIGGVGLQLTEAFDQGAQSYMPGVLDILHTYSVTGKRQEHYTDVTDFTGYGYREEGDSANTAVRYKGFDSSLEFDSTSATISMTQESIDDNEFSPSLDQAILAGRMAERWKDRIGYQVLVQGFDNNNRTKNGFNINWFNDGKAQFSVAHPSSVPGGSTQSNASATGIIPSEDNLEVVWLALENQEQDNGELLDLSGNLSILAPIELQRDLQIILETDRQVGSDYNDINVWEANGTFGLKTSKYMGAKNGGTATNWFAVDNEFHKLYYVEREGVVAEYEYDSKTRMHSYIYHSRSAVASKNWKRTWGSKGGAQAYSA